MASYTLFDDFWYYIEPITGTEWEVDIVVGCEAAPIYHATRWEPGGGGKVECFVKEIGEVRRAEADGDWEVVPQLPEALAELLHNHVLNYNREDLPNDFFEPEDEDND